MKVVIFLDKIDNYAILHPFKTKAILIIYFSGQLIQVTKYIIYDSESIILSILHYEKDSLNGKGTACIMGEIKGEI